MILIQGGTVIDPKTRLHAKKDILIHEGNILKISDTIFDATAPGAALPGTTVIDATGCIVAPGLIDTHSHFRDPGFTEKEDIHTGSLAAAKGGYTSIVMMANTKPAIDCPDVLQDVLSRGEQEAIHVYSAANVTEGMEGEIRSDLVSLKEAGAVVFTDDGKPITDDALLLGALKLAKKIDMPISLHEEDPKYVTEAGVNAGGAAAASLGLTGADRRAESSMIERDVKLAIETGAKLLIQHISSAEGVELVRQARLQNPQIHAEATPHHFSLTEEAVISKGTLAKVNPPIRLESDRLAIIEGLRDGTIDIIATDHAPHTAAQKAQEFTKAPSGMIGLETALSLSLKNLVQPGYLTMDQMLAALTCNPADYYHLPAGTIKEGATADLVIFHPEETWTVTEGDFASKSSNSPFIGETLPGVIYATIAGGKIAYRKS